MLILFAKNPFKQNNDPFKQNNDPFKLKLTLLSNFSGSKEKFYSHKIFK